MASLRDVPLGQPRIRWSELTDDSPEYFKLVAAAPQDHLVFMWAFLALYNLVVSIVIATVFWGVVVNPRVRRKPFNVFLLFLMVPDFLESFFCFLTCWLSAWKGEYYSPAMCRWQSVYMVFGTASKGWLSFLATYQVHRLLVSSKHCNRYVAPGPKGVIIQSLIVYAYSFALSMFIFIPTNVVPHELDAQFGFVCLPMQNDGNGGFYLYGVFFPLFMGIPAGFMIYMFIDVWYRQLLPKKGTKSRKLAMYFLTIDVIFLACWGPTMFVVYILQGINTYGLYAFTYLAHGHGAFAAIASTFKPDIQRCMTTLLGLYDPGKKPIAQEDQEPKDAVKTPKTVRERLEEEEAFQLAAFAGTLDDDDSGGQTSPLSLGSDEECVSSILKESQT